jgi:methionine-gamma-lyase
VNYPGLESHPQHALAKKIMKNGFGGIISFELKEGFDPGIEPFGLLFPLSLSLTLF